MPQGALRQGREAAVTKAVDEWTFTNTGIGDVERVLLYALNAADEHLRLEYPEAAYRLGRQF